MPAVIDLELEGMTCAACASRIERKLNKLDGVEASVNYATEKAAVSYDDARVSVDELLAAVAGAGYRASLVRVERPLSARKLVVSAALTAPAVVVGMSGRWAWLAFALSTPVVWWGGW